MLWLIILIILMIVGLVKYQDRAASVFAAAMLVTLAFGWVSSDALLRNASNPGVATLVMLVLISFALEKTSVLRRLSTRLFSSSVAATTWRTIGFVAFVSSVLNNTAVVAALMNSVRNNKYVAPTKLLIPLSYAAIMGGMLTLIGTSTNLIVNSMFIETGHAGFGFFDFTLVGLGVLGGGSLVLYLMTRYLPAHEQVAGSVANYVVEARLDAESPLVGKSVEQAGLRHLDELFLVEIVRKNRLLRPVARYDLLEAGDKLIFSGNVKKVMTLKQFPGLELFADKNGLSTHELSEVIVRTDSVLVGRTLKSTGFRARFDAAVVALRRDGTDVSGKLGEMRIHAGDFLLLATGPDFAERSNLSKNFYLLSGIKPENMLSGWREKLTVWGFLAMLLTAVTTGTSLFVGSLFLLALLIFSGCLTANEIKRRVPIEIWVVVTSALCIATALTTTGLSAAISEFAQSSLSGHASLVVFIGVILLTYLLTELITNNAAAALMFPIAYSLAVGAGIDPFPMVLGVAFAASASFITPYGYQTNLMVFNASTYKLKHFFITGLPVAITYLALCVVLIPLVYPL